MNALVLLAVVAGWCPTCGWDVPVEWRACPPGRPDAGLVALFFEKAPTVGPQVEQEWCQYLDLLDYSEQCELMVLWHKADVCGKLSLINQVRLMKAKYEHERLRRLPEVKPEKEQPADGEKKIEKKDEADQRR